MNPNRVDLDLSTANAMTSVIIQDQLEWTQELRLESQEDTELDWVLGIFYADSEIKGDSTRWYIFEYPAPIPLGVFNSSDENTKYSLESENIAVFASVLKNFTDKNSVHAGLRFDHFRKTVIQSKRVMMAAVPLYLIPEVDESATISSVNSFSGISPTIQWNHDFSKELIGLARITYAEKPGGFSAYTTDKTQVSFLEEETLSYEISLLFNPTQSWGFNLTGFINYIQNYQFELPVDDSTNYYVDNADEVTAQGIEVEGFLKPSENFTFSAAYGLCDSKYDKFDGSGLVGKQVSCIPEHTLSFSLNY